MSERTSAYASAVVEIARAEGDLDAVETELLQLAEALDGSQELRDVLGDPGRPLGERLAVVETDVLAAAMPATRAALAMLVASDRVGELPEIAREVAEAAAQERGAELAEVVVAVELDDDQRERLRRALEQATGRDLDLRVVVDRDVVGGVRAVVGDTVIDGSLSRRLDDLRARVGA